MTFPAGRRIVNFSSSRRSLTVCAPPPVTSPNNRHSRLTPQCEKRTPRQEYVLVWLVRMNSGFVPTEPAAGTDRSEMRIGFAVLRHRCRKGAPAFHEITRDPVTLISAAANVVAEIDDQRSAFATKDIAAAVVSPACGTPLNERRSRNQNIAREDLRNGKPVIRLTFNVPTLFTDGAAGPPSTRAAPQGGRQR